MIKPEFWEDTTISDMPPFSRLLYIALWNFADDEGYLKHDIRWLKVKCFPYDDVDISELLEPLFEKTRLEIKNGIIKIKNFQKYQTIQKKIPSTLIKIFDSVPEKSEISDDYSRTTVGLQYRYSSTTVGLQPKRSKEKLSKDKLIREEREKEREKEKNTLSGKEKKYFSEFVRMTHSQYDKLVKEYGEDFTRRCITRLDLWLAGKKDEPRSCHYSKIKTWVFRAVREDMRDDKKLEGESSNLSPKTRRILAAGRKFIERGKDEPKEISD